MPELNIFYQDIEDDKNIDTIDILELCKSKIFDLKTVFSENITRAEESISLYKKRIDKLDVALSRLDHDINSVLSQRKS